MRDASGTVTVPVDEHLADLALDTWRRFGKGRHPAALNLGDCFSYALAAHLGVPLLCIVTTSPAPTFPSSTSRRTDGTND